MAERRFEFSDDSSKKFWAIEVADATVTVRFGRLGTEGSAKEKVLDSPAAAAKEAAKLIAEKTKKGYVETGAVPVAKAAKAAPAAKAATPTAGAGKRAAGPSSGEDDALDAALVALDAALKGYAPKALASLKGTMSFNALEAHVTVPASLRKLWGWANGGDGCGGLFVTSASDDDGVEWEATLSVAESASALTMLRETASFPETLIPVASDGNGNYLVVDPVGAVLDWDHETRKTKRVSPSLAALLKGTLQAIKKGQLFGGPEPGAAVPNPAIARMQKLLKKLMAGSKTPEADLEKVTNASYGLPSQDVYDALLRPEVRAVAETLQRHERTAWVRAAVAICAELGRWDELFAIAPLGDHFWTQLGDQAFAAGALEAALRCFEEAIVGSLAGDEGRIEGAVGAAYVTSKLGRPTKTTLARCNTLIDEAVVRSAKVLAAPRVAPKKFATDGYDQQQRAMARLLLLRAVAATIAKDDPAAKRALAERATFSEDQRTRLERIRGVIDASGVLQLAPSPA